MARSQQAEVVEAAGREVRVTSPHKVFFPKLGATKLDLVRYYLAVEEPIMRAMGDRPTLMQRFPHGAGGQSFFQKRVPDNAPDWLETTDRQHGQRHDLAGAGGQGRRPPDLGGQPRLPRLPRVALPLRPRRRRGVGEVDEHGFRRDPTAEMPADHRVDELRIDLDPQPGTGFAEAVVAAGELRTLLAEHGIAAHPKTTASRGVHVYVRLEPKWTSYQVRAAAVAVARELERRRPDILTAGVVEGGAGRSASSSTTTRTPRTRPSSGPGRPGRGSAARCRRRCRGTSWPRSTPTT